MIRCRHGENVQIGEVAKNITPRGFAEVGPGCVPSPLLECSGRTLGGFWGTSCHCHKFKFHCGKITRMLVEADARELASDAKALEIGVSAEMNIAAKHTCANQGKLDSFAHDRERSVVEL